MIDQRRVHELLQYDPFTGLFTWRESRGSVAAGAPAGTPNGNGYVRIRIDRARQHAHRLAILYMTGEFPEEQVDHINGIRSDNRWENLRLASHGENCRNAALSKNNTSGVVGVSWMRAKARWQASITVNGRMKGLGKFDDKFEAVCARKSAELRYGYHENHGRRPA